MLEPKVKSETEKLLRKALEDYENKKFVAKADSLTVGELLDMWAEEELKTEHSVMAQWKITLVQSDAIYQTETTGRGS